MNLVKKMVIALGLAAVSVPLLADPPGLAPAHGWRKKNDPHYVGYTGRTWQDDYGIRSGRCNREAVGAALGGVVGGLAGSAISDRDSRTVAILLGSAIGALIGARIGRDLDETDRACIGHALELAAGGRQVKWVSEGVTYTVIPGKASGKGCRSYTLRGEANGRSDSTKGTACRRDDGAWVPRG